MARELRRRPNRSSKISKALSATQDWLGRGERREAWTGRLYQSANRLAHLYWFREKVQVEAWLVHILFLGDRTHGRPTTREEWENQLPVIEQELGEARTPFAGHAFLDALAADELLRAPLTA
jgi:hypothetical protein